MSLSLESCHTVPQRTPVGERVAGTHRLSGESIKVTTLNIELLYWIHARGMCRGIGEKFLDETVNNVIYLCGAYRQYFNIALVCRACDRLQGHGAWLCPDLGPVLCPNPQP